MKRILALLLVIVMVFSLVACGKKTGNNDESTGQETEQTGTETTGGETVATQEQSTNATTEETQAKTVSVVGKWIYNNGEFVLEVKEDNTGAIIANETLKSLTWQYDESACRLLLTTESATDEATYKEDEDAIYLGNWCFVRTDNTADIQTIYDAAKTAFMDMVNAEYAADLAVIKQYLPGIVCWGDSLTSGAGGNSANYPQILEDLIKKEICKEYDLKADLNSTFEKFLSSKELAVEIPVVNMGVGGEDTYAILGRNGAIPYVVSEPLTIPAGTTPIEISFTSQNGDKVTPLRQGSAGVNPVTIGGVEGTLTVVQESFSSKEYYYQFTRTTAGEAVSVPVGTKIVTAASSQYLDYVTVIFMGTNGTFDTPEDLIAQQRAIIDHQIANKDRFLIIGLHTGWMEDRIELEEAMVKEYGDKYFNLRDYMAKHGMQDAGLEPSEEDRIFMLDGRTPNGILSDGVHFKPVGYKLIAQQIYKRMDELGYFNEVREALTQNFE